MTTSSSTGVRGKISPTRRSSPWAASHSLQSDVLSSVAARLGLTPQTAALAWLLQRSTTILLIPGTSSVAHLRENIAAADVELPTDAVAELDQIGA